MTASGSPDAGLPDLEEGLAQYQATDAAQMRSYGLCLLADAYQLADRWEDSIDISRTAIAESRRTGVVFYLPEAYRLLGQGLYRLGKGRRASARSLIMALRTAEMQCSVPLIELASQSLLDIVDSRRLRSIIKSRTAKVTDDSGQSEFYKIQ